MKIETKKQIMVLGRHLPFEVISLVLQGGGALGAYQAGVYEAVRGGHSSQLDRPNFHRSNQCRDHRRQSARLAGRSAEGVLDTSHVQFSMALVRFWTSEGRSHAQSHEPGQR
jgi:hypothetical protein